MKLARRRFLETAAALAAASCAPKVVTEPAPAAAANTVKPADALGDYDAVGVAARIRSGEITAADAAEAAIARAEATDQYIHSIVTKAFDRARDRAKTGIEGPFAGVPALVKDLDDWAGLPTMQGSRAYRNNIATKDDPYIAAMFAAGLNPIGKSTTPEFGLTATTEPMLGEATRNPWDTTRSSGGSSGGAAAAVAAGIVPIAHASDGGGSVRIPASCCGLFGLKTSRWRDIGSDLDTYPVSIGINHCVSRTVRDSATWLAAMERTDAKAPLKPVGMITGPSQRRLKIGLALTNLGGQEPDADVRASVLEAAELCRSLGHEVFDYKLPLDGEALVGAFTLYWASGAQAEAAEVRKANPKTPIEDLLEPWTLGLEALAVSAGQAQIEKAIGVLKSVEAKYSTMFVEKKLDVLLTPVLGKAPVPIGAIAPTKDFEEVRGVIFQYVGYTPLQNVAGAPGMSVPLGTSGDLPIGIHFAGAPGQDAMLLALAYELEQARPWTNRRPKVHA